MVGELPGEFAWKDSETRFYRLRARKERLTIAIPKL